MWFFIKPNPTSQDGTRLSSPRFIIAYNQYWENDRGNGDQDEELVAGGTFFSWATGWRAVVSRRMALYPN